MKVLLLDAGPAWRGGQQQVRLLAGGLAERNHSLIAALPPEAPLFRALVADRVVVEALSQRSDIDLSAAVKLARLSREFKPHIVHANDARSHGIARLAQLFGLGGHLVVTRRSIRKPRSGLKYRRGVERFIAISDAVKRALELADVPTHKIDVVKSAVPLPTLESPPTTHHPPPGKQTIITIAALTPEKDIGTLVRAAALAHQRGIDASWVVLGEGKMRRHIEAQILRESAPVRLAGHVDDVTEFLAQADLLVHPAPSEALGTCLLEALSMGVPVVAIRAGGIPEVVTADVGTLVEPRNPEALVRAVAEWLADHPRREAVRKLGPEVTRHFDVNSMVDGTVRSYLTAVEETNFKTEQVAVQ